MRKVIASFFLAVFILITGCAEDPLPAARINAEINSSSITSTPTNLSALTNTPTQITTATFTPTRTQRPTQIITASATATPSITYTPIPLSDTKPWLLYMSKVENRPTYFISNLDGSSERKIELPDMPVEGFHWSMSFSPDRKFIILHNVSNDLFDPYGRIYPDYAYEIQILTYPELGLVRRIPLFNPEAIAVIKEFKYNDLGEESLILAPIQSRSQLSPDGRYLAYTAVPEGIQANLYVYDFQKDRIIQISEDIMPAVLISWSPDSQHILFEQPAGYVDFEYWGIQAVHLGSIDGSSKYIFSPDLHDCYYIWYGDHNLLIANRTFEGPESNLRLLDTNTESMKTLFPGDFSYLEIIEPENSIYLGFVDSPFETYEHMLGLYKLNLQTGRIDLRLQTFDHVLWDNHLQVFYRGQRLEDDTYETKFYNETGKPVLTFQGLYQSASTDNEYLLIDEAPGTRIINWQGKAIKVLGENDCSNFEWIPNTKDLISINTSCDTDMTTITILLEENNWEGTPFEKIVWNNEIQVLYP
jgi:hypothetical protein